MFTQRLQTAGLTGFVIRLREQPIGTMARSSTRTPIVMKVFSHNGGRTEAATSPIPKLSMPQGPEGDFKDLMSKATPAAQAAPVAPVAPVAPAASSAPSEPALDRSTVALAASSTAPR